MSGENKAHKENNFKGPIIGWSSSEACKLNHYAILNELKERLKT